MEDRRRERGATVHVELAAIDAAARGHRVSLETRGASSFFSSKLDKKISVRTKRRHVSAVSNNIVCYPAPMLVSLLLSVAPSIPAPT